MSRHLGSLPPLCRTTNDSSISDCFTSPLVFVLSACEGNSIQYLPQHRGGDLRIQRRDRGLYRYKPLVRTLLLYFQSTQYPTLDYVILTTGKFFSFSGVSTNKTKQKERQRYVCVLFGDSCALLPSVGVRPSL